MNNGANFTKESLDYAHEMCTRIDIYREWALLVFYCVSALVNLSYMLAGN